MNSFELERFEDILPVYIQGNASKEECFFVDHLVNTNPKAKSMLLINTLLAEVIDERVAHAREHIQQLSLKFNKLPEAMPGQEDAAPIKHKTRWQALLNFLPHLPQIKIGRNGGLVLHGFMATAVLVAAGFMVVGTPRLQPESVQTSQIGDIRIKSSSTKEQPILRVSFQANTTEAQMRKTLQACNAYFIGGPNQLGDYWVYSPTFSQSELKAELLKSGIVDALEYDPLGPKTP